MKVAIIGSGGREHTLTWVCSRSRLNPQLFCIPGNGGTAKLARNVSIPADDLGQIVDFVRHQRIDLTIVGPEAPLVGGLTDKLQRYGYPAFGPTAQASRIEGSKSFAKKLMNELGVPTAEFLIFSDVNEATKYITSQTPPLVVKASGLAAGKGSVVCTTTTEATATAIRMLSGEAFGESGREIVIEQCLFGREMSLMALVDGENYLLLSPSRDHKRAYDGDEGPNTGGMGAYAPLNDMTDDEISSISGAVIRPIITEMCNRGTPYRGLLYPGLMMTSEGVKVIEYNCRWGDPEAQAVLPLIHDDMLEVMAEVAEGGLKNWMRSRNYTANDWRCFTLERYATTVVAAMEGYPGEYRKGVKIESLPPESDNLIPFHSGTLLRNELLVTNGGRVLSITGIGDSIDDAMNIAYDGIKRVQFDGLRYRNDIGRSIE